MDNQNRFAKNMIAKGFSLGVNLIISFFLTPYILAHVGTEAYGFVGLANDFVDVARIAAVALNSMALRFIAVSLHQGDEDRANRYFSSVMIANLVLCLLFFVPFGAIVLFLDKLFYVSSGILSDVRLLWVLIFFNFFLNIMGSAYGVALFAKNRIDQESMRSAESIGLRGLFLVACYSFFAPNLWYVGASYCVLTIYVFATNVYYTKKYLPFLSVKKQNFDKKAIKTLFSAGSWNCLTKVATILATGLDLVLINRFAGKYEMGIAAVSKTLPNTILSVFVLLSAVFLPRMTECFAKEEKKTLLKDAVFSIKLLGVLACIPIVTLFVYGDVFYFFWTPTENASLLWQLSIFGSAAFLVSLSTQNLWNLFTVTKRVKISSLGLVITSAISIFTVLLSMLFVKNPMARTFFVIGTSSVCQLFMTIGFLPHAAAKCVGCSAKIFYRPMGKTVLLIGVITAILFAFKCIVPVTSVMLLLFSISILCLLTLLGGLCLVFDKKDRTQLKQWLKGKQG